GASGIRGLQREGGARRRIQASLLADSAMAEIESAAEAGTAPPVGEDERVENGFRIHIAVDPYTLAIPDEEGQAGHRLGKAKSRLGGDAGAPPPPTAGPSLLGGDRGSQPPLRRIVVRVEWDEGFGERSTTRVTHALDGEAASATLGALSESAASTQQ